MGTAPEAGTAGTTAATATTIIVTNADLATRIVISSRNPSTYARAR